MDPSETPEPMETNHEKGKVERLRRAMYSRVLADKLKDKERRGLEEHPELVGEDWMHPDEGVSGTIIAPRGLTVMRSILQWLLVAAAVFFVGSILFFAYYFTFGSGSLSASANNIDLIVSGPPQVAGGEPTEIQVSITNRNRVPLELSQLVVTYPDGTRSVNDLLTPLPSIRQDLQTIQPGETKQGVLNAIFSGQAGEHKDVKVELEYRLSGSNAIFVASRDYSLLFGTSPLTIAVDGNTSAISGQPVSMTVSVSSNSNTTVRDVILHADFPFGFSFTDASPHASDAGVWNLGDIGPGQKKEVVIDGTLLGEMGDDKVFDFTAGGRTNASSTSISTQFAENPFSINVAEPFLGLSMSVNRSTGSNVVLAPGDLVQVILNYVNNLPTQITDAVIVARLSGVAVDGATVQSSDGFYRSTDNIMLWDKITTEGRLGVISAGQKGSVTFSFKVPDAATINNISSPYIDISVNAKGNRISEVGAPQNLQSATVEHIALASDLQLSAQGLYFQNPFGSTGSLPPQAGKETNYAIVFTIKNTTNKIIGAKVTAVIPPYVRWLGSHAPASENLTFNQNSSTFTWDVGDIEPGVGMGDTPPRQLAVSIGFDPSTSQVGQQPVLIQGITLIGTDDSTKAKITRTTRPDVTTDLIHVSKSSGDVVVGTDKGFNPDQATVVR
ncbi:hypothetical protein HZC00_02165 [Candidatus Kaiserbacteria bacterium]|nr:hypothetical protein [Candidatus Kaiserbacteria bacterium]